MVFSWFIFGALIFHAQALVCDGSAYILEFLTFNKGPIVFLMVLYMKQGGRCQVGSVVLNATVFLFSGVSLVQ